MMYSLLTDKNKKMKKIISLLFTLVLIIGCSEQAYYEIPKDANGNVILTGVSSTTTTGISNLDNQFSVTATFATAKSGDVMNVECLQLQVPPSGGATKQLLPLAGTQKTATVGADLKATITYTRAEAKLMAAGEYVTVVFNGKTDYAKQRVDMVPATVASKPRVSGKDIDVARTSETAFFNVTVTPKAGAYTGNLIAKRKNGVKAAWVDAGIGTFSGTQPFLVPISGDDFAAGKDTMFYSFKAALGSYTDEITTSVIVRDPYFYLKKSGTMTLGGAKAGVNMLKNTGVSATDATAIIAVDGGTLMMHGGVNWATGGKSISFVPSTQAQYTLNNSTAAIAAFEAGTPLTVADPASGAGVYIFKIINGANPTDVIYGMIKVTSVVPGVSITYEYRIGNLYAHLTVIS